MTKSVYIKTFGCQMNKADSRRLEEIFVSKGYEFTDDLKDADVIVFNTCSVREHAEQKALSHIGRLKFLKTKKPEIKICVVGCMAQRLEKDIISRFPQVDFVVGPSSLFKLPELIENDGRGVFSDNENTIKEFSKHLSDISDKSRVYTGYVPIMKGCNNFCSYCIVPYVRGREQYRPVQEIVDECSKLAEKNIKEIMLLGQAVNAHPEFKDILRKTVSINDVERIRFVTSYPGHMDKETVDIVADSSVLCNYFHIPLQSGSNDVLKAMKRRYTVEEYLDIAGYIREKLPAAAISSDFIVGFPGETDDDFNKTLDVVKEIEFDQCFTFKYSPRPGTAAEKLDDSVPMEVKKDRLVLLNDACERAALKRNEMLKDKELEVCAEDNNSGRTGSYKIVFWEGKEAKLGEIVKIKISETLPHSLKGVRI